MSLMIDVEKIEAVLLADGWHEVESRSFNLDSYEYVEWQNKEAGDFMLLHGGGRVGVCATGFTFRCDAGQGQFSGPLTSILAVRHRA